MTMLKVLKPFNTKIQRFAVGDEFAETADLSPHTVAGLTAGKFIAAPDKSVSTKAKSKASE